jgi:hypothetical protein
MLASRGTANCAITRLGELKCWGSGPVVDFQPSGSFSFVSVGNEQACAVRLTDKRAICWSKTEEGQASVATTVDSFAAVYTGGAYTCGLRLDGKILCWGLNDDGAAPQP